MYDVVIVGGGPAGLSAALVLGRCRRRVLVCDAGDPRNIRSRGLHGYLTRDGIRPAEFLERGRNELASYGIVPRDAEVSEVLRIEDGFRLLLSDGGTVDALTVLLATGVRDDLPDIPGLLDCYGITVHHCPYCDGWEVRDKRIAVIGSGVSPAGLALSLKTWTDDLFVCTLGTSRIRGVHRAQLSEHAIPVHTAPIRNVVHRDGHVSSLQFADGTSAECDAIFFTAPQRQQCDLAEKLGCEFNRRGTVKTDHLGKTCVSGLYVVGDASRDVQFVVVAAAEGAKAGVAINKVLQARAGLTAAAVEA